MADTSLKVVVEVDPSAVSEAVAVHAERLREEGRREVAQAVYLAIEKDGEGPARAVSAALMATAGPSLMQDIIAEQVVAEVRQQHEDDDVGLDILTCPDCGGEDRLNNIIRAVGHPQEGERCRHQWHREVDL